MFLKALPPYDPLPLEACRRCLVLSVRLHGSPRHAAAPSQ